MKKEQVDGIKMLVNEVAGKAYKMTYASKSETLHIRVGTYTASTASMIESLCDEREKVLSAIKKSLPDYSVERNNKRYQGIINDICITIK